tara:strand:+ start:986 stop:1267 length:282 start_codon:yes stop_codon:yes gene_type:complete
MGYDDPKYFARLIRRNLGFTCKYAMVRVRVEKFIDCIKQDPDQKNYCFAKDIGLLDEISLNKYLRKHVSKNPTQFRAEIREGAIKKTHYGKKR